MPLQNHIHLSEVLETTGEKAPDIKWTITDRLEIPTVIIGLKRGLTGKLYRHVLMDESGPIQLTNFKYTLKLMDTATETLEELVTKVKAYQGKEVYLCDIFHADDHEDHTNDVREMVVGRVGELAPVGPGLPFFTVDIELEDNSL